VTGIDSRVEVTTGSVRIAGTGDTSCGLACKQPLVKAKHPINNNIKKYRRINLTRYENKLLSTPIEISELLRYQSVPGTR
jgi:hypothetical protein